MIELQPSDKDDSVDKDVFSPVPPLSRRALRAAEKAAVAASAVPAVPATASVNPFGQLPVAAPIEPVTHKLHRKDAALVQATKPKHPRKHPAAVLATMVAITGMVAVVALPAYAMSIPAEADAVAAVAAAKVTGAQSLSAGANVTMSSLTRDGYSATTPEQMAERTKDSQRAALNAAYNASGARELGDDYPWAYELMANQGGGLSPLNYYYRECVDFVAWRLNRDAGSFEAPFKFVWSNLTPSGGNASQWPAAWARNGWTISKTPVVGSVAYTGNNHVAYVKAIIDGGFVLLEEYNYVPGLYGQRTVPISEVASFLYPPGT